MSAIFEYHMHFAYLLMFSYFIQDFIEESENYECREHNVELIISYENAML